MANRSYLSAVPTPVIFPTLRKARDVRILACKDWGVGVLWFALFQPDDWQCWRPTERRGGPEELQAPIAPRRDVAARLGKAAERLEAVAPKVRTWRSHLQLLRQAIDKLPPRYQYLTCEWQEIIGLDSDGILDSLKWLVRFYSGQRVVNARQTFEEVSGLKLSRSFRDPATTRQDEFEERDWQTLDALLGVEWKRAVPWRPRPSKGLRFAVKLTEQIEKGDVKGVQAALAQGAPVTPDDVCAGARQSAAMLQLLLEAGGTPNNRSARNGSALVLAFHSGREVAQKVNLLLDAGADPNLSGYSGSDPVVLYNCFAHGLDLAPRIIEGTSEKLLQRFLAASETERFEAEAAKDGVTWKNAFLSLVRKRLKKLQRK